MSKEKRYPPAILKTNLEFVLDQDIITIATDPNKLYTKEELRKIIAEYKEQEG